MSKEYILEKNSHTYLKLIPKKKYRYNGNKNNLFFIKLPFYNLFKYLLKLASLIFVRKKTKINYLWFLEMKLGKYIITYYVYNSNLKKIIDEVCISLCLYNNKFVLIFFKYIDKCIYDFIWIKTISKKKTFCIILGLIGLGIFPPFFILKIFRKIKRNKFNSFLESFLNLINYKKLFQIKMLGKNIKQTFTLQKKKNFYKQFEKKIIIFKHNISKSNYKKLKNNTFYSLFLEKKKINYELKKINFLFFIDFKNELPNK
nr:hypothetical protein CcurKRNrm1_p051 [Cryptomonas curvata]